MYVFGEIDKTSTIIESNIVSYTQNLTTSSAGIQSIKITSGSTNNKYWQSLNTLFYTSGSGVYSDESKKFARPLSNISLKNKIRNQYLTKYHGYPNISLITIPAQYYGEKIKRGSFKFIDISGSNADSDGNQPTIVDDGFGNLYSTNAAHSQSAGALSSSDNYVGNIFYDLGLVLITETGSWSGDVTYSNLATNFELIFQSHDTIKTHEYNVNLKPQEFNYTMNYTVRNVLSGSSEPLTLSTPWLAAEYTGSDFQPYITTINLYRNGDYEEPVIQATLPKPIRKSDKINTRFKIKLDL
jgi:hypothetical protein